MSNPKISVQSHEQAMAVAKATQKPGQSKEQTKLIAAGIEKGIAQYKKQHKAKMRQQDKQRKKQNRATLEPQEIEDEVIIKKHAQGVLPWVLLVLSWLIFGGYFALLS